MKKVMTLVLSLVLSITMITGCGKNEESKNADNKSTIEEKQEDLEKENSEGEKEDTEALNGKTEDFTKDSEESKESEGEGSASASLKEKKNTPSGGGSTTTQSSGTPTGSSSGSNSSSNEGGNNSESKPVEKPVVNPDEKPAANYVTMSIMCNTLLNNMDKLPYGKKGLVPANGVISGENRVEIKEGETVFDVLLRETRRQRIHMDFVESPVYKSAYIRGMNNLYEFDGGDLSGWMYSVNGVFPQKGCSQYKLEGGEKIEWKYTCDLGKDL